MTANPATFYLSLTPCHITGQASSLPAQRLSSTIAGSSPDSAGGAFPDQRAKSGGIPVRKPDTDGVAGAGGKVVEFIGALTSLEDAEIVAEPWAWQSRRLIGSVPCHSTHAVVMKPRGQATPLLDILSAWITLPGDERPLRPPFLGRKPG